MSLAWCVARDPSSLPQHARARCSTGLTLALMAPSGWVLVTRRRRDTKSFLWALFCSSMSFFLASFQGERRVVPHVQWSVHACVTVRVGRCSAREVYPAPIAACSAAGGVLPGVLGLVQCGGHVQVCGVRHTWWQTPPLSHTHARPRPHVPSMYPLLVKDGLVCPYCIAVPAFLAVAIAPAMLRGLTPSLRAFLVVR